MASKHWLVITPEYSYTEVVCEYGGPTYGVRDVVEVEAKTAREAVRFGAALMLACRMEWVMGQRSDRLCPYAGVYAEEALDRPRR